MSTDLREQVRLYAEYMESGQMPVTMTEISGRVGQTDEVMVGFESRIRSRSILRGPWPALVAAVLALVVFGLLAWLLPGRDTAQPADTVAPATVPPEGLGSPERVFYVTSGVPDGFAPRDLRTIGQSRVLYLAESGDTWLPSDGGFAIEDVSSFFSLPEKAPDPDEIVETYAPGSDRVTVGGRPGAILETRFNQDDVTTPLIWVLGVDDRGGVFEVSAIGMSRDEVLAVADGVRRVPVDDFLDLGSELTWDVKIDYRSEGLSFQVPPEIVDVADAVQVALGSDLLRPRLSNASQGTTVVTTETGEIVESDSEPVRSDSADVFVQVSDERLDQILSDYPGLAELSPVQRDRRIDRQLEQIVGQVLSEDPHVVQAIPGPESRFDTGILGEEIPLVPAQSAAVVPSSILNGGGNRAAATFDRPVVVIGRTAQPGSEGAPTVTALIWFTETGVVCEGAGIGEFMGSGCGFEFNSRFGFTTAATGPDLDEVEYVVPLETSVVQLLAESGTYWQRPRGGHGVVPFGNTVSLPETVIAFDADGHEIGRWENDIIP